MKTYIYCIIALYVDRKLRDSKILTWRGNLRAINVYRIDQIFMVSKLIHFPQEKQTIFMLIFGGSF